MDYGFWLAATGIHTNSYRLDVAANNLANVQTNGYKPDFTMLMQRLPERIEDNLPLRHPNVLLEQLGGGALVAPTRTNFTPGVIEETSGPLDVALKGPGFLAVDLGKGQPAERLRFTRDGRMTLDEGGWLTHIASRGQVVDENDQPIRLNPASRVTIDESGCVIQDGIMVARLQVSEPADLTQLRKNGQNMFSLSADALSTRRPAAETAVLQQHLELSGVDPIKALLAMSRAASAVEQSTRMLQYHDETIEAAISRFGRVT